MTSIIVLVPETGQVLLQKNVNSSNIPSITYLPMGGTFTYGQRFDVRLEKFKCEHHITSFLPVSEFIMIVAVQKNEVQVDEEHTYYMNCVIQDFAAGMVLLKGRNELSGAAFTSYDINLHTNRLQREFQMFTPFFEQLIRSSSAPSVLLNTCDFILSEKRKDLNELLEGFTESCECLHACIMMGGKIVCGTSEWFKLIKIPEMRLIVSFVTSIYENTLSSISDIPVYLPYTNPAAPIRLLRVQLMQDAMLCMLCENDVKIQTVINQIEQILATKIDLIQGALHIKDRCFPIQSQANAHVQAFCCYSRTTRLSVLSFNPHTNIASDSSVAAGASRTMDKDTMRTYLCDFIKTNFEMIRMIDCQPSATSLTDNNTQGANASGETPTSEEQMAKEVDSSEGPENDMSELYWVKKGCKVFLLGVTNYIMIVLFNSETPTYPMRSISTTLLESITSASDF
ncbi:protein fuzzy homolog [Symsagittifera roscoffensis]|uniref:protein fuzzy homolog n=1 Tax=Symsagittifera roscoffensis TaxID=84072 RepID=UPI00307BF7B6